MLGHLNRDSLTKDLLASIVVFLVALPLCMGIAIASGAPPAMGIISGIIGGLVVGSIAGCPLQVSGPAAGLAVIVYELIQTHGIAMLGPIVLLAGAIQLVAGLCRAGQLFRAISPSVIYGMLAGIGVLIFASQFHVMVDDRPPGTGKEFDYKVDNKDAYELCVTFKTVNKEQGADKTMYFDTRWLHDAGYQCLKQRIAKLDSTKPAPISVPVR